MAGGNPQIAAGHPVWWGLLEQVRTFCLAPNAEERGQFERFNGEIVGTDLGARVGRGLVGRDSVTPGGR